MYNNHMRYFDDRQAAGRLIADQLAGAYRYEDCAVIALNDGAVLVGFEIAIRLHCIVTMLLTAQIKLPRENDTLATIDHNGLATYGDRYSIGELEAIKAEYMNYIEQEKIQKKSEINKLLGDGGVIDPDLLRNRVVIVVSDGLMNGMSMRAASQFLKPLKTKGVVMVAPFATVAAVDQMHVLADKIVCLNVFDEIISVDHYYERNELPPHEQIIKTIQDVILKWQ